MSHPPSPSQQRLTAALRSLRENAGLSTYGLKDILQWTQSKVSRIENGTTRATVDDVEAWAAATGASADLRDALTVLAEAAWTETQSWRAAHRRGLAARQRGMGVTERAASEILHFTPACIPGLLQAEGYARRVLTFGDVSSKGGIDAAVAERMKRQAILREEGRRFEYVLTEGALRWKPGPAGVMEEQLEHLLALADLPAVSLSVIPFRREPAAVYLHPFALFRIPDAPVVLVENYHAETFVSEPSELAVYERIFAALRASAVTGAEAADFARSAILGLTLI
jgi:transcriptional regulator with XRE-family HTH domain